MPKVDRLELDNTGNLHLVPMYADGLTPFWSTSDGDTVRLYHGDVVDVLARLPERSVQCVVTSPPYWGLRDYKTGTWEGGDPNCDHKPSQDWIEHNFTDASRLLSATQADAAIVRWRCKDGSCPACGAVRIDKQIGSEQTPEEFVAKMVEFGRGVRRVLRDDGTFWLNLGDSYTGGGGYYPDAPSNVNGGSKESRQTGESGSKPKGGSYRGLAGGNLVGIPWRVALALQADGWILRQDIVWAKPSPMPESVRNRCTKAHEYIFLLTKSMDYFYDADAIKDKYVREWDSETNGGNLVAEGVHKRNDGFSERGGKSSAMGVGANKRSVWTVATAGYPGAHFATFPPKLIEPCILAGTSAHGACADCGAPWRRVTARQAVSRYRPNDYVKRTGDEGTGNSCANSVAGVAVETLGFEPTCECHGELRKVKTKRLKESPRTIEPKAGTDGDEFIDADIRGKSGKDHAACQAAEHGDEDYREITETRYFSDLPLEQHPVVPCTVLDPFVGSGTTCCVAVEHGRRGVGIDLSEKYLRNNAIPRIEGVLSSLPATAHLVGGSKVPTALGGKKVSK